MGKSALAVQIGNATTYNLNDSLSNLVMLIADNDNILLVISL